jgi:hypothetical protein
MVAILLPEILMDTVLGLLLYGQVVPAFMLLLGSMQFLAVLTLALERICECWMLWMEHRSHNVASETRRAAEN